MSRIDEMWRSAALHAGSDYVQHTCAASVELTFRFAAALSFATPVAPTLMCSASQFEFTA